MARRSTTKTSTKYLIQLPMQYQTSGADAVKGNGQTISINSKAVSFAGDHDLRGGIEVCLVISWPAHLPDGTALNLFMFGSIERSLSLEVDVGISRYEFRTRGKRSPIPQLIADEPRGGN
jgi:hypothetical protein